MTFTVRHFAMSPGSPRSAQNSRASVPSSKASSAVRPPVRWSLHHVAMDRWRKAKALSRRICQMSDSHGHSHGSALRRTPYSSIWDRTLLRARTASRVDPLMCFHCPCENSSWVAGTAVRTRKTDGGSPASSSHLLKMWMLSHCEGGASRACPAICDITCLQSGGVAPSPSWVRYSAMVSRLMGVSPFPSSSTTAAATARTRDRDRVVSFKGITTSSRFLPFFLRGSTTSRSTPSLFSSEVRLILASASSSSTRDGGVYPDRSTTGVGYGLGTALGTQRVSLLDGREGKAGGESGGGVGEARGVLRDIAFERVHTPQGWGGGGGG
eukprot:Sspe_Gene.50133::Locus_27656_Transcript_1_1_Confidence_1.000_Length_1302::g.50133::m.50133